MKKIIFFVFAILYSPALRSMHSPLLSDLEVPSSPLLTALPPEDDSVPVYYGAYFHPSSRLSLKTGRAVKAVNDGGLILPSVDDERIKSKLPWARKLILHGQETSQLYPFCTQTKKESLLITKLLAVQLLQLKIIGVDDEGRLDPRLTTLAPFLVGNPRAFNLHPLRENDCVPHRIKRKLFP
jgi:hypothetical protein